MQDMGFLMPQGSMCPNSIYFGLKAVLFCTLGPRYLVYPEGTYTLLIMEFRSPPNHYQDCLFGPNSIVVAYGDPPGWWLEVGSLQGSLKNTWLLYWVLLGWLYGFQENH